MGRQRSRRGGPGTAVHALFSTEPGLRVRRLRRRRPVGRRHRDQRHRRAALRDRHRALHRSLGAHRRSRPARREREGPAQLARELGRDVGATRAACRIRARRALHQPARCTRRLAGLERAGLCVDGQRLGAGWWLFDPFGAQRESRSFAPAALRMTRPLASRRVKLRERTTVLLLFPLAAKPHGAVIARLLRAAARHACAPTISGPRCAVVRLRPVTMSSAAASRHRPPESQNATR